MNKAVVIMRDWFTDLDSDALPAVRQGEEALLDRYLEGLREEQFAANGAIAAMLTAQSEEVQREVAALPRTGPGSGLRSGLTASRG